MHSHKLQQGRGPEARPPGDEHTPVIRLCELSRTFTTPFGGFAALRGVSLDVRAGEFMAVVGRSGSGKSTLLNLMSGIDRPSAGEVQVAGTSVHTLPEGRLAAWRGRNVGVVFQFFQLLPTLTIAENVMLPMDFCRTYPARARRPRALELLDRVGIAEQADKLPAALSVGQQQRAAIARALANDPPVVLADEPTGNLDSQTADVVFQLLAKLADGGKVVVIVTHDRDIGRNVDRVIALADGAVDSQTSGGRHASRASVTEDIHG